MRIYLSGPITGQRSQELFDAAEARLQAAHPGAEIINPYYLHDAKVAKSWSQYMKRDIHAMLLSDVVYMLAGWQRSRGARLEHRIACELDYITLRYEDESYINSVHIRLLSLIDEHSRGSVTYTDLSSRRKDAGIPLYRHIYLYFMRRHTGLSLAAVGAYIRRDHATVLNSISKVNDLNDVDAEFRKLYIEFNEKLAA